MGSVKVKVTGKVEVKLKVVECTAKVQCSAMVDAVVEFIGIGAFYWHTLLQLSGLLYVVFLTTRSSI